MLQTILFVAVMSAQDKGEPNQAPSAPTQTLFQEMKVAPTGKNGMEEYLIAADMIRLNPKGSSVMWQVGGPGPTQLQRFREVVQSYPNVVAMIEKGNSKPVSPLQRKFSLDTTFPELASFRRVADVVCAETQIRLAEGQPTVAARALIANLTFAENAGKGPVIAALVGSAISAKALHSVRGRTTVFSQSDSRKISTVVTKLLDSEPAIAGGIEFERAYVDLSFNRMSELDLFQKEFGPLLGLSSEDDTFKAVMDSVKDMTPQQWRQTIAKVKVRLNRVYDDAAAKLRGPEREWLTLSESTSDSTIEDLLVGMFSPALSQAVQAVAIRRTQLRILRLHMAISDYFAEHVQMPESLKALNQPEFIFDPLSNTEFVYEVRGPGAFRVYSRGAGSTGEIDLVYTRVRDVPVDLNPPPRI